MIAPQAWSFQHLNSFTPYFLNLPAGSTLAYWLGVAAPNVEADFLRAYDWHSQMSTQFTREEQAQTAADLCTDSELIPHRFRPVAPVTLSRLWSPIPLACDRLGVPLYSQLDDRGRAIAAWLPSEPWRPLTQSSGDVAHFELLVGHAVGVASATQGKIVLVAEPGWSYDGEDFIAKDKPLRRLMRDFGFIVSQRKPRRI